MNMRTPLAAAALLASLLLASAASADVVASYTFDNTNGVSSDTDPSTAGTFAVYVGNTTVNSTTAGGGISSSGNAYLSTLKTYSTDESGAVTNGTYYSFTLTPAAGTALQLTSLTFELGGTSNNLPQFDVTAFLRTSLDGFASDTGTVTSGSLTYTVANNSTGTTTWAPSVTLDLSSLTSITATTTFEIYVYTDLQNLNAAFSRIDDVTLNATTTAIPEPATYALAAGVCAGLLALVRRRKKSRP